MNAFRFGHAIPRDLGHCLAVWRDDFLREIVGYVRCFAELRRSVASHARHTLHKQLDILARAVCLRPVLSEYVDKAVGAPVDHGQASSVWQCTFSNRSDRQVCWNPSKFTLGKQLVQVAVKRVNDAAPQSC